MEEIYIIYWSQTGNTQTMAEAIGKGVEKAGKTAQVLSVEDAALDVLKQAPCFALGCPAMGAEVLALRAESGGGSLSVEAALPLVTVAASLGELELLYPDPTPG